MTLRGPLQQLIERWRAAADADWHKGHDDVEDGVWAYQHEANGAARARRKDADELSALLASVPEVSSSESRTILLEALIAARDTLIGFQKDAGRLPQGGYSTTMTDAERKLTQAVRDIDSIIDNEAALSALSDVPSAQEQPIQVGRASREALSFLLKLGYDWRSDRGWAKAGSALPPPPQEQKG